MLEAVGDARSLLASRVVVLRPSEDSDLPQILARRLFEPLPMGLAGPVAERYAATADAGAAKGLDLPDSLTGPGWASEVGRTFPFHPDLVRALEKRLYTIPNFQRTQGGAAAPGPGCAPPLGDTT